MEETKAEELKQLINSSPIFEINEKESPQLYITEREKLTNAIVDLYGETGKSHSGVIYFSLLDSLKYYDKAKGDFLSYFHIIS